ncbi:glycosyltransferase family A protein [uncultured Flavobacterium sp.]|uniref:glycosyltransferase family A protein n=1 Tax=uncultured Flavobacterium sp. TaxID=165435 RepID=UPI0025ED7604|nr:glycosyltransferase family A protein [uncultured Flavobacterium sp.]
MIKITVFTPTFNRAYRLKELYDSLLKQTFVNFEWLVVDDGSTDNTEELIAGFKNENRIQIRYFIQKNGGKHVAINKGAKEAGGELFFIADSDDILPENALEKVAIYYETVKSDPKIGGVSGRKAYYDGKLVGNNKAFSPVIADAVEIRYEHKIQGDLAEVFKTQALREFPFPEYENEKFCPEVLIWNRISSKYKLLYFDEPIYLCEYLEDGLTAKIVKIRMNSPLATMDTYAELEKKDIPMSHKLRANINFWRFSFNSKLGFSKKISRVSFLLTLFGLPIGFAMFLRDKRNNS